MVIFVPKALLAYQVKRIEKKIKALSVELAQAGDDAGKQERIMNEIGMWTRIKVQKNNKLGR